MVAGYLLSLLFAIAYGTTAALNKRAAAIMLPVLDVLQSVPILGFFPAALVFFVNTFQGSPIGLELAIVFLIFTSMSWNMAFGVYEALTTIPHDLEAASAVLGLRDWLRFRRLMFPATIPKLVYNSMLSWTVGWFYLVASEIFTAFGQSYARPGLGSFIANAGIRGDAGAIVVGLGALAAVVLSLDTFVWRPLSVWSERFRMDVAAGGEVPRPSLLYERLRWLPRFPRLRKALAVGITPALHAYDRLATRLDRVYTSHPRVFRTIRRVDLAMFLIIFVTVVSAGLLGLVGLLLRPLPPQAAQIPVAIALSFSRLALAYAVALLWTTVAAAWIYRSKAAARVVTPFLEVVASIPATALLPAIIGFSVFVFDRQALAPEFAAFLVALFAMQWYLLFNLIAGFRSIPADLEEAARALGLRGRTYWRRVLLPAAVPSLLTGSMTAWGAGWNALIVSEYMRYGATTYQVLGLGALLDIATYTDDSEMILFTILSLTIVVLLMNKLLWRPLLKRASVKYRIEVA